MRPLAVTFRQPALCNFPCFIQCSEQIKIQYFCPVCPVEPFDKGILRRLAGPDIPASRHALLPIVPAPARPVPGRCPSASSADIHGLPRSCPALSRPAAPGYSSQFRSPVLAVKIIHHVEGPEASAAHQRIVHKIDGPALVHHFRCRQRNRVSHRQARLSLTAKIQFQQAVNTVNSFMVPDIALPAKYLKKLFKSISRLAFNCHGQRHNHRLITLRIRLITKYRPAKRQRPACLA